jgi:putative transposase
MAARAKGFPEARLPWKKTQYRDTPYTNQAARVRKGNLLLPNGKAGTLQLPLPRELPGKLMEARLLFGRVLLVCEVEGQPIVSGPTIGVDLGVNTLISATDGERALLVSGREAKSTLRWRNKRLGNLSSKQAHMTKGSRRWRRTQRRKYKVLGKARNKIRDLTHKATRKVADFFPGARVYVGKPFNDAAQRLRRVQAQQVSQACTHKIISQLDYKTSGAIKVSEAYSSQTCPVCGCRHKCRRTYRCPQCGFVAPRDVVGSLNIRVIGKEGCLKPYPGLQAPRVLWVHPIKYPGFSPGSPLGQGHVARASENPA